jgi:hypothetical protein
MALVKRVTREREGEKAKPTRYYSKKQEDAVAKNLGGKRNLNSGATMFQKGDVVTDQFLLECKTKIKDSDSIVIKKDWIQKNKEEAAFMGKHHQAVVFNFGPNQSNYYIIEEYLFQTLLEYLNQNEE